MAFAQLVAKLGFDSSAYDQGLARAQSSAGKFAGAIKNQIAGAFTVAAGAQALKQTTEYAGKIADLSKKLNISTDALQEFEYAASQSGATLEDIGAAFKGLAKAKDDALGGSSEKMGAFELLGITRQDLQSNSLENLFRRIANGIRSMRVAGDVEQPVVEKLLGKSGGNLLATFKNDLAAAADEFKRLGMAITPELIAKLDAAGDKMDRLGRRTRPGLAVVAGGLADVADWGATTSGKGFEAGGHVFEAASGQNAKGWRGRLESLKEAAKAYAHQWTFGLVKFAEAAQVTRAKARESSLSGPMADGSTLDVHAERMASITEQEALKAKEVLDIRAKIRAEQAAGAWEALNATKKILQLQRDLKDQENFIGPMNPKTQAQQDLWRAQKENELAALQRSDAGKSSSIQMTDQYAKIGLFVGGKGSGVEDSLRKQLEALQKANRELHTIARNTSRDGRWEMFG